MNNIIFVAPYFLSATVRFIDAVASVPGCRTGLICQDPFQMLPPETQRKLRFHRRVQNGMDGMQLLEAARELEREMGPCHRLFGALEDLQVPIAHVREAMGIKGMGVREANNFRDKSTMKNVMRAAGLPCARHRLVRHPSEAQAFLRQVPLPYVVKPPAGAGSRNTFQVNSEAELTECLRNNPPSALRPVLLEEFIQGQEFTFDSVLINGKMVWHSITRYYPTPLEVLKNPWIQWCILLPRQIDTPEFDDIRQAAGKALRVLGLETGLSHMEWFRRHDGTLAISEVAARPPGAQLTSIHGYAHDFDLFQAWAHLMATETFKVPPRNYAAGVAFLRGMGRGRVKAVHGLKEAAAKIGSLVIEAKLPKPGQRSNTSYEGDGYIIMRHPDTEVVKEALRLVISTVRVELA